MELCDLSDMTLSRVPQLSVPTAPSDLWPARSQLLRLAAVRRLPIVPLES